MQKILDIALPVAGGVGFAVDATSGNPAIRGKAPQKLEKMMGNVRGFQDERKAGRERKFQQEMEDIERMSQTGAASANLESSAVQSRNRKTMAKIGATKSLYGAAVAAQPKPLSLEEKKHNRNVASYGKFMKDEGYKYDTLSARLRAYKEYDIKGFIGNGFDKIDLEDPQTTYDNIISDIEKDVRSGLKDEVKNAGIDAEAHAEIEAFVQKQVWERVSKKLRSRGLSPEKIRQMFMNYMGITEGDLMRKGIDARGNQFANPDIGAQRQLGSKNQFGDILAGMSKYTPKGIGRGEGFAGPTEALFGSMKDLPPEILDLLVPKR